MMKLSTKGRYATRIMVCLAMQHTGEPCRKQEIADAEEISADYVEQILIRLKAAGLVVSHRGARGGFSLARDPATITVEEVLQATEGPVTLVACEDEGCTRETLCVTRNVWRSAEKALSAVFSGVTVEQLAEQALAQRESKSINYEI